MPAQAPHVHDEPSLPPVPTVILKPKPIICTVKNKQCYETYQLGLLYILAVGKQNA
jgi:hypothetical protein